MKDQYFGDINDYRKYGLLRAIIRMKTRVRPILYRSFAIRINLSSSKLKA